MFFKLSVKARLMIVFLMISLIPLMIHSVSAYFRAKALLSVDPAIGAKIISGLLVQIIFISAIGIIVSVVSVNGHNILWCCFWIKRMPSCNNV